jgi:hypothetical protein
MESKKAADRVLDEWLRLPETIEKATAGTTDDEMDRRVRNAMSPRETVNHLVEANIVACSMMIAALGASGSTYDWSWLYPNSAWIERMGYGKAPVEPALAALKGLCRHFANLINARPDALRCEVRLFDSPGAETYTLSVAAILQQELDHAAEHLGDLEISK